MKAGFWKLDDIETVYGSSAGSIMITVVLFAKLLNWDIIYDYVTKRPWKQVFSFDLNVITQSFYNKGIFDNKVMEDIYRPLLAAIDKDVNITLKEFYEITNIECHYVSSELTTFQLVDFSYKTHPDWRLVDAIYCSGCLPFLFSPYCHENKIYADGSLFMDFPIKACVNNGANRDHIFGIAKSFDKNSISALDSLYNYISYIFVNLLQHILVKNPPIKYCVNIQSSDFISIYNIYLMANNPNYLLKLVNEGVDAWKYYYARLKIHNELHRPKRKMRQNSL